jgi:hypothetical protein
MANEIILPTSIVAGAILSFIANYFTTSKKLESATTRIERLDKDTHQMMEEIKHLRETKENLAIQREKLDVTSREVEQLKNMQESINLLQLRIQSVESKFELSVERILSEIKSIKNES